MFNLSAKIKQYFYQSKHSGELDTNNSHVVMAEISTPDGYTHLQLFIEIDNAQIKNCKFKVLGCPTAIACLEFTSAYLVGKTIADCKTITAKFLIDQLDIAYEKYAIAGLVAQLIQVLMQLIKKH